MRERGIDSPSMEGDEEETNENMARKWELDDGGGFGVTTVPDIGEERG